MSVNSCLIKRRIQFLNLNFKITFPFCDLHIGIFASPQGLKQESDISKKGGIMFSWKEIDCEHWNGVFFGYEIKLYHESKVCTERVIKSVTTFTVQPKWKPTFSYPKAISVAGINEAGVGSHCPPVKINALITKTCLESTFASNEIVERIKHVHCMYVVVQTYS